MWCTSYRMSHRGHLGPCPSWLLSGSGAPGRPRGSFSSSLASERVVAAEAEDEVACSWGLVLELLAGKGEKRSLVWYKTRTCDLVCRPWIVERS